MPSEEIVTGVEQVVARFDAMTPALRESLIKHIDYDTIDLQQHIQENKLEGQVLHHRTGNLIDNIFAEPAKDLGEGIEGRVFIGAAAPYGFVHEFGGTFTVPAHRRMQTMAWGREIAPVETTVSEHLATYPERSFMRTGLAEKADDFMADMDAVKAEVANG
jgi:phage gpG-like protein